MNNSNPLLNNKIIILRQKKRESDHPLFIKNLFKYNIIWKFLYISLAIYMIDKHFVFVDVVLLVSRNICSKNDKKKKYLFRYDI